jgi:glycosyltransferase involved in cell wall biosynthesis
MANSWDHSAVRFALYHPWIYLRGGAERVIGEVVRRSAHDWTIFTHHLERGATFPELNDAEIVALRPEVSVQRSLAPLLAVARVLAAARLPDVGASALLVSSEGLGDFVLNRNSLRAACYCHTPLKILHDEVTRERLRHSSPAKAAALSVLGPAFTAADRRLWRRYRHVLVNSREVAGRVKRAGLVPGGPVEVLHPGVDVDRFSAGEPPGGRSRTLVVAGRIMWQKNIELAIDAFGAARARGLDAELVVAGAVDAKSVGYLAELRGRASAAALPVRFETDVTDERMAELLSTCLAVVHPSPSEDFGISPVEAMAAGAPVLAVDAGGTRETVVDGKAGWLVPADTGRFADTMVAIGASGDELAPMRAAARLRAADFAWGPFVTRIDEVMEKVATS